MENFRDEGSWRTVGGDLYVQELTEKERQAAEKARAARDAELAETLKENLAAPIVAEEVMGEHIDVAVARASVIETPAEKRNRQLGLVEVNGKLMHKSEARRRAELREQDENGVTPEQRAAMEQYLASDEEEESDDSFWNDE